MTGGEVLAIGGAVALGGIALAAVTKPTAPPPNPTSKLDRITKAAETAALIVIDPLNLSRQRDDADVGRSAGNAAGRVGAGVGEGASKFGTGFAQGLGQGFEEHPVDTTVGFLVIGGFVAAAMGLAYALRQPIKRAAGVGGYY